MISAQHKRPGRPAKGWVGALLVLSLSASACGGGATQGQVAAGGWPAIVNAADEEGRVTVYSSAAPATLERIDGCFGEARSSIDLEFVRGTSGELVSRIDQERASRADGADAWLTTELEWFAERSAEKALHPPAGPALDRWPAEYREGDAIVGGLEPLVVSYNTDLVRRPPQGYQDLLAPEYRGTLGTSELAATAISAWYAWLDETVQPGFLAELAAQEPRLYVGSVPISQAVASGEITGSAYGIPTAVKPLMEQGAPIDYVVPTPSFGVSFGVGALGWAYRPNAALVFLDFLMSPEGQQCWHGGGDSASPLPGIEGSLDAGSIDPWDYREFPESAKTAIDEKWNGLFVG